MLAGSDSDDEPFQIDPKTRRRVAIPTEGKDEANDENAGETASQGDWSEVKPKKKKNKKKKNKNKSAEGAPNGRNSSASSKENNTTDEYEVEYDWLNDEPVIHDKWQNIKRQKERPPPPNPELEPSISFELYRRAVHYFGGGEMQLVKAPIYLVRQKEYILRAQLEGFLPKFRKGEDDGRTSNLINGKLHGIFLQAFYRRNGTMPDSSYYGDHRLLFVPDRILNPNYHNFYFADLYCLTPNRVGPSKIHKVIIVICERGSSDDEYCLERLRPMDPLSNPFIKYVNGNYFVSQNVQLKLFYTGDVRSSECRLEKVKYLGDNSMYTPCCNRKDCEICSESTLCYSTVKYC